MPPKSEWETCEEAVRTWETHNAPLIRSVHTRVVRELVREARDGVAIHPANITAIVKEMVY